MNSVALSQELPGIPYLEFWGSYLLMMFRFQSLLYLQTNVRLLSTVGMLYAGLQVQLHLFDGKQSGMVGVTCHGHLVHFSIFQCLKIIIFNILPSFITFVVCWSQLIPAL